jgi:hypothetical protein
MRALLFAWVATISFDARAENPSIMLDRKTLVCERAIDYYLAFEEIVNGSQGAIEAPMNCLWTSKSYFALNVERHPNFYLANVTLYDPEGRAPINRGWVGLSSLIFDE